MDIVLLVGRNDQRISLYTDDIGCFYFCNQFLEVFMKRSKIKNVLTTRDLLLKEMLLYCYPCHDKIKKLLDNSDTLSDEIFLEARKRLIQYYPNLYDKRKLINIHLYD